MAITLLLAGMAQTAVAATASELFADGNRLFRDDLYWAALLRYQEAAEAGMDTPLLHYNTGVAHYKAAQHIRARESLEKAALYAPLAPISHYNLGLNAYALGAYDEASDWFRRAANQKEREDIARLALRAFFQLERELEPADPVTVVQTEVVELEEEFTNLDIRVRTGIGMDDNVFRTPSEPYVDFSNPTNPIVVPENFSGMYIPLSINARYQVNAMENEGFFGWYRFGGRFYNDEQMNNADEYLQEIAFGSEFGSRAETRETRVFSAFKIAQHEEIYYDPDNGNQRVVNGVDISDRMSYLRYGPEFWARESFGRYTFGFRATGRLYNYEDVVVVPEYDHEYWLMGLSTDVRLTPTSLLRVNADYYTRRFGDRPSFNLDGTQPADNPTVRYDYLHINIEARQRLAPTVWFGMGYSRVDREDRHVGYNNYIRDAYTIRLNTRFRDRFTLEASARFMLYNYEHAFAFHQRAQGRKTMERTYFSVLASYAISEHFDIIGEYIYRNTASNDDRLAYGRGQAVLGVRWIP